MGESSRRTQELECLIELQRTVLKFQSQLTEVNSKFAQLESRHNDLTNKFTDHLLACRKSTPNGPNHQCSEAVSDQSDSAESILPEPISSSRVSSEVSVNHQIETIDNKMYLTEEQLRAIISRSIEEFSSLHGGGGIGIGMEVERVETELGTQQQCVQEEQPEEIVDFIKIEDSESGEQESNQIIDVEESSYYLGKREEEEEPEIILGGLEDPDHVGIETSTFEGQDSSSPNALANYETVSSGTILTRSKVRDVVNIISQETSRARQSAEAQAAVKCKRAKGPIPIVIEEFEDRLGNIVEFQSAGKSKLFCPLCTATFCWPSHLRYHYNSKHLDAEQDLCRICKMIVPKSELESHKAEYH